MLPESSGRLVALRVSEKLTKEDMVSVAPPLEEKIRENGKVDLFCDMMDLHGWSLGGLWAELKFDAKHARDFRRVAVITGKPLHRFMASMLKPFTSAENKVFSTREKIRRSNLDFPQLITA
jgi:SpoIIAA-like